MPGLRSAPRTEPARRSGTEPARRSGTQPALPAGTRLVRWREDDGRAQLVIAHAVPLRAAAVDACVERAWRDGYTGIVTSALGPAEQTAFVARGFGVREHLHLLVHPLRHEPAPPPVAVRRVRRRERAAVIALDDLAFSPGWRLGARGLHEALHATPLRRFRATGAPGAVTGYAITGFDGRHAYLQRLAVHPGVQRRGLGGALVADALRDAWRRGAARAFVNTQRENTAALALYTAHGFEQLPGGLAVLELDR